LDRWVSDENGLSLELNPLLVAAVIRRQHNVLLVRQYGPDGPDTAWALPGGRCHPGELAVEALAREVKEETGLTVSEILGIAYVAQLDNPTRQRRDEYEIPAPGSVATVLAFEVAVTSTFLPTSEDPDGYVTQAVWWPESEAAELLFGHPFLFTGAPAASRVVQDVNAPPAVWQLRRRPDGHDDVESPSELLGPAPVRSAEADGFP
jgi:ADP-ribose pyrophosphatase YjhB (NUDIX family)